MPTDLPAEVTLQIYEGPTLVATFTLARPAEIGRREPHEPVPYVQIAGADCDRIVVADKYETNISRKHLRIEPQAGGAVVITNESAKNSVALPGGQRIGPGERRSLSLPVACELGTKVLRVEAAEPDDSPLQSLREPTLAPGRSAARSNLSSLLGGGGGAMATLAGGGVRDVDFLGWLQASMEVFHSAAASPDFLPKAVQAASQMVSLDTVAVLLRRGENWTPAAVCHRDGATVTDVWHASQSMLARVVKEQRTFYQVPPRSMGLAQSLIGVESIVAAPILDPGGQVIGVLYGEGRSGHSGPVKELEAKLFELIAYGVASGLARIEQEQKLIAERVRFEQFFTPELARMLEKRGEDMLAPRDTEVTVLFCDIRGFSRVSLRSKAEVAIEWVREVLSEISDCVADLQGVLVDYGGDSLEALWGAPLPTPNHAAQACEAALKMRSVLPELTRRWQERLGEPTDISIGIHTGPAQVGNIGSRRKFKYGAFGTTVNLASRVQGATKHVGMPTLITKATADRVAGQFSLRRLCSVRTVNIIEPVELYELAATPDDNWQSLKTSYEEALALFEQAKFVEAMGILGRLVAEYPSDEPTRKLVQRNVACLSAPPTNFDAVWNLESK
jgi:adenylate cyclase